MGYTPHGFDSATGYDPAMELTRMTDFLGPVLHADALVGHLYAVENLETSEQRTAPFRARINLYDLAVYVGTALFIAAVICFWSH